MATQALEKCEACEQESEVLLNVLVTVGHKRPGDPKARCPNCGGDHSGAHRDPVVRQVYTATKRLCPACTEGVKEAQRVGVPPF
jgi:hypothetical protein